jgi:hypothetical protein
MRRTAPVLTHPELLIPTVGGFRGRLLSPATWAAQPNKSRVVLRGHVRHTNQTQVVRYSCVSVTVGDTFI